VLRRLSALLLLSWFGAAPVQADESWSFVKYECRPDLGELIVDFAMTRKRADVEALDIYGVDLRTLFGINGDYVKRVMTVQWMCDLADGRYRVTVGPRPGAYNVQRQCGAWHSGWVEIVRLATAHGDHHFPRVDFVDHCFSPEYISRVRLTVGARELQLTKLPNR
jgi:hypothetical protein